MIKELLNILVEFEPRHNGKPDGKRSGKGFLKKGIEAPGIFVNYMNDIIKKGYKVDIDLIFNMKTGEIAARAHAKKGKEKLLLTLHLGLNNKHTVFIGGMK